MRKVMIMSLLLAQLAATAFAYTNQDAGFKTLSPAGDNYITAAGKNFYGFIEDGGRNAGYAEVLQPEAADKFLTANLLLRILPKNIMIFYFCSATT